MAMPGPAQFCRDIALRTVMRRQCPRQNAESLKGGVVGSLCAQLLAML